MENGICIMSTLLVGGTHRHYVEMAVIYSFRVKTLLVEFDRDLFVFTVLERGKVICKEIHFSKMLVQFLIKQFSEHNIRLVHLHHMMYMCDELYKFLLNNNFKLAITLHDYYTICPQINMMCGSSYCNEACEKICDTCMVNFTKDKAVVSKFLNIANWRRYWFNFLENANYLFVPSFDQRDRLLRYFPLLANIRVVENPEIVNPITRYNETIRKIGILGTLSEAKGRSVLLECARIAEKQNLNMQFVLFGTLRPSEYNLPANLIVKGKYKEDEVYSFINSEGIDFFWFTAIWPETYSYVLTIPIRLGIPVIAADLGAIGERIKRGGWGEVYPVQSDVMEILHALSGFDYGYYRKNGDFEIKNNHFLSFQDMYCDDSNIFSFYDDCENVYINFDSKHLENNSDVNILGNPHSLQPREVKYLWDKQLGLCWKFKLLFASDKSSLFKKIFKISCKKICNLLQI